MTAIKTTAATAANDADNGARTDLHRIMPAEACSDFGCDDDTQAVRRFGRELLVWLVVVLAVLGIASWKACEAGAC